MMIHVSACDSEAYPSIWSHLFVGNQQVTAKASNNSADYVPGDKPGIPTLYQLRKIHIISVYNIDLIIFAVQCHAFRAHLCSR